MPHTLGKWYIDAQDQGACHAKKLVILAELQNNGIDKKRELIIAELGHQAGDEVDNAALIASAPELLEALEIALQADPNKANHSYYKRVINKAKGLKV